MPGMETRGGGGGGGVFYFFIRCKSGMLPTKCLINVYYIPWFVHMGLLQKGEILLCMGPPSANHRQ
jgi:hypothetical protein